MARTIAKDYGAKRRLILDRAAKLFADEGFDRASVSAVAKACNISKANIYHYYKSKDEILFDILDRYLSALDVRICGMETKGMTAEERFRATIVEVLLAYQGADNEHRLQTNSLVYLPDEKRAVLVGYQRNLVAHFSALVEAIAPEVFANDKAKLRSATMSLFGMLNWFYMWNRDESDTARKDYAEVVCKLCLQGIPGL